MYSRRIKRWKLIAEKSNPGEFTVIAGESKPREELLISKETFKRNPNRISLLTLNFGFAELTLWQYRDKPKVLGIAINREFIFLSEKETKMLYSAVREALKRMHLVGRSTLTYSKGKKEVKNIE